MHMQESDPTLFRSVHLPVAVRIGARATRELADDSARIGIHSATVIWSCDLPGEIIAWVRKILTEGGMPITAEYNVSAGSTLEAEAIQSSGVARHGIIAVGGGRALDVGKYAGALQSVPVVTVPTSLSHDGFASPSASLVAADGRRVSLACKGPAGVIVDTTICAAAPTRMFAAGVGDCVAKLTALADWWLLEHSGEAKVDGTAAVVAEAAIALVEGHPTPDHAGHENLARALLMGGVAMAIAGSSRPCSGAEHLLSHALDRLRTPPGSHGIQVGLAAYILSQLRESDAMTNRIAAIFDRAHFWAAARSEQLTVDLFAEALAIAPAVKPGYLTILSRPGAAAETLEIARSDPRLRSVWAE